MRIHGSKKWLIRPLSWPTRRPLLACSVFSRSEISLQAGVAWVKKQYLLVFEPIFLILWTDIFVTERRCQWASLKFVVRALKKYFRAEKWHDTNKGLGWNNWIKWVIGYDSSLCPSSGDNISKFIGSDSLWQLQRKIRT